MPISNSNSHPKNASPQRRSVLSWLVCVAFYIVSDGQSNCAFHQKLALATTENSCNLAIKMEID
jgi:hypothetical protein